MCCWSEAENYPLDYPLEPSCLNSIFGERVVGNSSRASVGGRSRSPEFQCYGARRCNASRFWYRLVCWSPRHRLGYKDNEHARH